MMLIYSEKGLQGFKGNPRNSSAKASQYFASVSNINNCVLSALKRSEQDRLWQIESWKLEAGRFLSSDITPVVFHTSAPWRHGSPAGTSRPPF